MKKLVQKYSTHIDKVVRSLYRYLHQHPELSFEERETAALISKVLTDENIPFRSGIGGYGIVARIEGKNPSSKIIALRADMDALPIDEKNELPFKSTVPNVMHACGHDAHTAMLIGAALLLNRLKDTFEGTVLCVFQPGEEKHPGGARLMLNDGIFDTIQPQLMIALHTNKDIPTGKVALGKGTVMASADEIHITVKGKGGHGALPHLLNDTVLAASQLVVSIQQIVSRRRNPFIPAVVTFGKFLALGATNIIPEKVLLSGTFRCMDNNERERLKPIIAEVIESTVQAHGCQCEYVINDGYPSVYNDENVTAEAREFLNEFLGKENVGNMEKRMTSEDFGFFSSRIPSTFFRLGVAGDENKECGGQHTSTFFIDENALQTGVGSLTYLALRFMGATQDKDK